MSEGANFSERLKRRTHHDASFRARLLAEIAQTFLAGDTPAGREALRVYIETTVGFAELASALGARKSVLVQSLRPHAEPRIKDLFSILECLQKLERVRLRLRVREAVPA